MELNIALCTDDRYASHCAVCVASILENNSGDSCKIYILTNGLNEENQQRFSFLASHYHQQVKVEVIGAEKLDGLQVKDYLPASMYYRFLIPEIVEGKRCLYMDCDIIVTGSLRELFSFDINQLACGVVEDQCDDDVRLHNRVKMYSPYFNSGVLLMNLDYWRAHDVSNQLIEWIAHYPGILYCPDQDALNVVLEGKVKFIDYRYNFQQGFYGDLIWMRADKWPSIKKAQQNPLLIHYTAGEKPWHKDCHHPRKEDYDHYQNLFPELKEKKTWGHSTTFYIVEQIVALMRKVYQSFRRRNGMTVEKV